MLISLTLSETYSKPTIVNKVKNSMANGFGNQIGRDIAKKGLKLIKIDTNKKTSSDKPVKLIKIVKDTTNRGK